MTAATRNEHDLLGERAVPAGAYWGIHTLRALENFPITGKSIGSYPELVRALALVKQAAALPNPSCGRWTSGAPTPSSPPVAASPPAICMASSWWT